MDVWDVCAKQMNKAEASLTSSFILYAFAARPHDAALQIHIYSGNQLHIMLDMLLWLPHGKQRYSTMCLHEFVCLGPATPKCLMGSWTLTYIITALCKLQNQIKCNNKIKICFESNT